MFLWLSNYLKHFYYRSATIIRFVYSDLTKDDLASNIACALTYTTLLSLVPLLAIVIAILSAFPSIKEIAGNVQNYLFDLFVPASREIIQQYLISFTQHSQNLTFTSTIFLVITSMLLIIRVERAFNIIWRVPKRRNLIYAVILYWGLLTLGPLALAVGFASTSYLTSLAFFKSATVKYFTTYSFILSIIPMLINWIAFTVLYTAVPNVKVALRNSIMGGLISAIVFEIAKLIFVYYATNFVRYQLIYGALATIPLFLFWIYISWTIILVGAGITYALSLPFLQLDVGPPNHILQAYNILAILWRAQIDGRSLSVKNIQRLVSAYHGANFMETIDNLLKKNIIQITSDNNFILARDVAHFKLIQLYKVMNWKLPEPSAIPENVQETWNKSLKDKLVTINDVINTQLDVTLLELFEDPNIHNHIK